MLALVTYTEMCLMYILKYFNSKRISTLKLYFSVYECIYELLVIGLDTYSSRSVQKIDKKTNSRRFKKVISS